MKALLLILTPLGLVVGTVLGVVTHQRDSATNPGGWTFYTPMPRRYADYLPVPRPAWFPGLAEYALAGGAVGSLAALLIAGLGFLLVRPKSLG